MRQRPIIDTTFDVRSDANGKDPDQHSPTLRAYHRTLWSKPLPSGDQFDLEAPTRGPYLLHRSPRGEFQLASDSMIPTYRDRLAPLLAQLPTRKTEAFLRLGYTVGGTIVFPGNRIDGKVTLNGARGMHPRIADRFDLTLECVRRHYAGEDSPLASATRRYADFFALFDDFTGYVNFFLLQDAVDQATGDVRFFLPFSGFSESPVPRDLDAYVTYMKRSMGFLKARNRRIDAWVRGYA